MTPLEFKPTLTPLKLLSAYQKNVCLISVGLSAKMFLTVSTNELKILIQTGHVKALYYAIDDMGIIWVQQII